MTTTLRSINTQVLQTILELHEMWLSSRGCIGQYANLSHTDLRGVDLSDRDLRYIDLQGSDLSRADLHGANLESATLNDTDLTGANLSGANLHNAILPENYYLI